MKRTLAPLSILTLALALAAVPASASTDAAAAPAATSTEVGDTQWIEDAPQFPVEPGVSADSLTDADKAAIAQFQKDFPWEEAYASYGCDATNITIGDDGSKSMLLECADAVVDMDDVSLISATAIAAADGNSAAVDAVFSGDVVDSATLSG